MSRGRNRIVPMDMSRVLMSGFDVRLFAFGGAGFLGLLAIGFFETGGSGFGMFSWELEGKSMMGDGGCVSGSEPEPEFNSGSGSEGLNGTLSEK